MAKVYKYYLSTWTLRDCGLELFRVRKGLRPEGSALRLEGYILAEFWHFGTP